ncbi:MAG: VacJ family lipoprotein [Psychrobium sp.]|nr:VacJ family lipoprotein [Psychrobium sp.]
MTRNLKNKRRTICSTLALAAWLSVSSGQALAQATPETTDAEQVPVPQVLIDADRSDPFDDFNRVMWDLNYDYLDKYLLRPTAVFYKDYIPRPMQSGIYNAATNLDEPSSTVNNMLQGNVEDSGNALARFLINSTAGLFGLFDVASKIGLARKQDEFGEVLATYGVNDGPYLMLPGIGPTTIRHEVGDFVDGQYYPLANFNLWTGLGIAAIKGIHGRAQLIDKEALLEGSLDPYSFVKEAYYQQRLYDIYDGDVPEIEEPEDDDDDDFDDEFDDE